MSNDNAFLSKVRFTKGHDDYSQYSQTTGHFSNPEDTYYDNAH
jgi:hypothetical protein